MTSQYDVRDGAGLTLGIDTSAGLSVGLAGLPGGCASRAVADTRSHVEQLMPQIDALLADHNLTLADVRRIGVGVGPGPFTGLRVGIATAQTLGIALDIPVRGVCGLDVLAWQLVRAGGSVGEFVAVVDARRKELYWARYDASGRRQGTPLVCSPVDVPALSAVGPGTAVYPDVFAGRVPGGAPLSVDAGALALALDDLPDAGLEPLYLRKPDADMPGTRKSVLTSGLRVSTRGV
jgi:tRNA threonylcarbamoyl adenosine modification protein YeaZ